MGKHQGGRKKHNEHRDRRKVKRASRKASRLATRKEMKLQERRKRRGLGINEEAVPR